MKRVQVSGTCCRTNTIGGVFRTHTRRKARNTHNVIFVSSLTFLLPFGVQIKCIVYDLDEHIVTCVNNVASCTVFSTNPSFLLMQNRSCRLPNSVGSLRGWGSRTYKTDLLLASAFGIMSVSQSVSQSDCQSDCLTVWLSDCLTVCLPVVLGAGYWFYFW